MKGYTLTIVLHNSVLAVNYHKKVVPTYGRFLCERPQRASQVNHESRNCLSHLNHTHSDSTAERLSFHILTDLPALPPVAARVASPAVRSIRATKSKKITKSNRKNMSRFSRIFTPADEEFVNHPLTTNKQKRRIRQMLLRFFSSKAKTQARPEIRLRDRARTMSMLSVWSTKDTPSADQPESVVVSPPSLPVVTDIFRFSVTCPEEEDDFRRDSKFSSFASLQDSCFSTTSDTPSSVFSVPSTESPTTVVLGDKELAKLQSLTRRATRSLNEQESLISAFSGNLASCLTYKENQVCFNLRLSIEWRVQITEICQMLRKLVGRMFVQKMVFTQRSMQLVQNITEQLAQVERNDEGATKLDIHGILTHIATLKENLASQATLDTDLRNYVAPPCDDTRLPATDAERAGLKRFVAFMDERLARLGTSYDRTTSLVEGIEETLKGLQAIRK